MSAQAQKIVQRIPLPWAVAITVAISLPFGLFLQQYNLPLWVSFIVWAEYFALGANVSTIKLVGPGIPAGALAAALWMATSTLVISLTGAPLLVGLLVGNFIWVTALLYAIPRYQALTQGTLAVFNGLSLFLAVYFTGSVPKIGPMDNAYWVVVLTFVWTVIAAYFGWFLGWLNLWLTFPKVEKT